MSHPVFLSSSSLPRMPEGSRNEWRGFFGHGGELEANAFFPLFWRALFSADDIRHAKFIDEYDIDDEDATVDRAECMDDFGAEATYPYLVTDKRTALARLASRREAIVTAVGERYRPIYDGFTELIAHGFADHLLLRTSGLPDAADSEQWLRASLAAIDGPDAASGEMKQLAKDLSRHDANPVWLLAGTGTTEAGPWPTEALKSLFPQADRKKPRQDPAAPRPAQTPAKPKSWLDPLLEWVGIFVAAGAGLGTYWYTRSVWLTLPAFLCAAVVVGFGIAKLRGPRS
ncbi:MULTISPECIES: hypothetical protein [Variovorax]|jgi:hypothetical protein|uniref:hypothetical protein n=1 Tax=Variovorax TaxID=34072 RepID=UPI000869F2A9|nr:MULTISPECIES: hypothetical protein [Variovorax]MBN8753257.1 hypothetical protein [Variovorax sp.]ODU11478.1 MAG: hypothetical protein ABS94_32405 [Variovorax sp. SCN 67-85]OJZ11941.1 MAG: hypothetical protein BGP22_23045 [Variovorax sp. 67-131]UKI05453.1 hypothetical protein L3V85_21765 [Variovorax paradoxus]|eukprot:gene24914-32469_t